LAWLGSARQRYVRAGAAVLAAVGIMLSAGYCQHRNLLCSDALRRRPAADDIRATILWRNDGGADDIAQYCGVQVPD
jgi:hypothetical protein